MPLPYTPSTHSHSSTSVDVRWHEASEQPLPTANSAAASDNELDSPVASLAHLQGAGSSVRHALYRRQAGTPDSERLVPSTSSLESLNGYEIDPELISAMSSPESNSGSGEAEEESSDSSRRDSDEVDIGRMPEQILESDDDSGNLGNSAAASQFIGRFDNMTTDQKQALIETERDKLRVNEEGEVLADALTAFQVQCHDFIRDTSTVKGNPVSFYAAFTRQYENIKEARTNLKPVMDHFFDELETRVIMGMLKSREDADFQLELVEAHFKKMMDTRAQQPAASSSFWRFG